MKRQVSPSQWTPAPPTPLPGLKRAELPDRQRRLAVVIAERQRALRRSLEQIEPHRIAQLVRRVTDVEGGGGVAPRTALDRDDVEPLVGELLREDRAGPAEADDHDVLCGQLRCHE